MSLGRSCFAGCSALTSINIPSGVKNLSESCFTNCQSLTSINIPSNVVNLEDNCFAGCLALNAVNFLGDAALQILGDDCFLDCSSLTFIDIPNSVKGLGYNCFSGCSSLSFVNIPNNVKNLRENCFADCSSLVFVNIPDSIVNLERGCFSGCSSLSFVNIPNNVKNLRENCFADCSSLVSIVIPSSIKSLKRNCFVDCTNLEKIHFESSNCFTSVNGINKDCFSNCPIGKITITMDKNLLEEAKIIEFVRNIFKGDFEISYKDNKSTLKKRQDLLEITQKKCDLLDLKNEKKFVKYLSEADPKELLEKLTPFFETLNGIFSQEEGFIVLEKDQTKNVMIISDLLGNYQSAMNLSQKAMTFLNEDVNNKLIILGNWTSRGSDSFITSMLMLRLKAKLPNQVILLRGNNENSALCKDFGCLLSKLIERFDPNLNLNEEKYIEYYKIKSPNIINTNGNQVYKNFMDLYQIMPIACIAKNIFMSHAGLPTVQNINSNKTTREVLKNFLRDKKVYNYNLNKLENDIIKNNEEDAEEEKCKISLIEQFMQNDPFRPRDKWHGMWYEQPINVVRALDFLRSMEAVLCVHGCGCANQMYNLELYDNFVPVFRDRFKILSRKSEFNVMSFVSTEVPVKLGENLPLFAPDSLFLPTRASILILKENEIEQHVFDENNKPMHINIFKLNEDKKYAVKKIYNDDFGVM